MLLHIGCDPFYFFRLIEVNYDNRLPVVNPQTHFLFHGVLLNVFEFHLNNDPTLYIVKPTRAAEKTYA
jgi:hypothetical protein